MPVPETSQQREKTREECATITWLTSRDLSALCKLSLPPIPSFTQNKKKDERKKKHRYGTDLVTLPGGRTFRQMVEEKKLVLAETTLNHRLNRLGSSRSQQTGNTAMGGLFAFAHILPPTRNARLSGNPVFQCAHDSSNSAK